MDKAKLKERREARFWSKVDQKGENDCWNWLGGKDLDCYGVFYIAEIDQNKRAHRIAWSWANKKESKQLILHKCDNPSCVNPNHLVEGTCQDNVADKMKKGRWKGTPETVLEVNGISKTIKEWSLISGITKGAIKARLKYGKSPKDAVFAIYNQTRKSI